MTASGSTKRLDLPNKDRWKRCETGSWGHCMYVEPIFLITEDLFNINRNNSRRQNKEMSPLCTRDWGSTLWKDDSSKQKHESLLKYHSLTHFQNKNFRHSQHKQLSIRLRGLEETLSSRLTTHFSASWSLLQGHENLTYLKPFPMSWDQFHGHWQHHMTLSINQKSPNSWGIWKGIFQLFNAQQLNTFATIQKLKPLPNNRKPSTFTEVAQSVLFGACKAIAPQPARIDLVVDNYIPLSIKNTEHERMSKVSGIRYVITSGAKKPPKDWSNFMSNGKKQTGPSWISGGWMVKGCCRLFWYS